MNRDELVRIITNLQNIRHMLMNFNNPPQDVIDSIDTQLQYYIDMQNKLIGININTEPEEMD